MESTRKRETTIVREVAQKFKNKNAEFKLMTFCQEGSRDLCSAINAGKECNKIHFRKIIKPWTDPALGDCSSLFLYSFHVQRLNARTLFAKASRTVKAVVFVHGRFFRLFTADSPLFTTNFREIEAKFSESRQNSGKNSSTI